MTDHKPASPSTSYPTRDIGSLSKILPTTSLRIPMPQTKPPQGSNPGNSGSVGDKK